MPRQREVSTAGRTMKLYDERYGRKVMRDEDSREKVTGYGSKRLRSDSNELVPPPR